MVAVVGCAAFVRCIRCSAPAHKHTSLRAKSNALSKMAQFQGRAETLGPRRSNTLGDPGLGFRDPLLRKLLMKVVLRVSRYYQALKQAVQ